MPARERLIHAALWLALVGYALLLAPPSAADALDRALAMLLFDTDRADPIAIAVFNLLGVLPAAFMALILFDRGRPSPWPFALGAFVLGGFVLLPYLALRDTAAPLDDAPAPFVRIIGSRVAGIVFLTLAAVLVGYAVIAGSPAAFADQFQSSKLIGVMTVDLVVMTVALHLVAAADRRRRGFRPAGPAGPAVRIPLLGPLLYLALRPEHAASSR